MLHLRVKTLTNHNIDIDVDPSSTFRSIKDSILDKMGIQPDQQRIIFSGKQMQDDMYVSDVNIKDNDVLHLVIRLTGG